MWSEIMARPKAAQTRTIAGLLQEIFFQAYEAASLDSNTSDPQPVVLKIHTMGLIIGHDMALRISRALSVRMSKHFETENFMWDCYSDLGPEGQDLMLADVFPFGLIDVAYDVHASTPANLEVVLLPTGVLEIVSK